MFTINKNSKYPICVHKLCPFSKTCAQHETAGEFRSEDGFRPELEWKSGQIVCKTKDRTKREYDDFKNEPDNINSLWFGMVPLKAIHIEPDYEI